MPKTRIRETDNTTAVLTGSTTDILFLADDSIDTTAYTQIPSFVAGCYKYDSTLAKYIVATEPEVGVAYYEKATKDIDRPLLVEVRVVGGQSVIGYIDDNDKFISLSGISKEAFIISAINLGGIVYLQKEYNKTIVSYLKSRNQYNVKFLLTNEKASYLDAGVSAVTTDGSIYILKGTVTKITEAPSTLEQFYKLSNGAYVRYASGEAFESDNCYELTFGGERYDNNETCYVVEGGFTVNNPAESGTTITDSISGLVYVSDDRYVNASEQNIEEKYYRVTSSKIGDADYVAGKFYYKSVDDYILDNNAYPLLNTRYYELSSELKLALEIAEFRKDVAIILGTLDYKVSANTKALCEEELQYVDNTDGFYAQEFLNGKYKGKYVLAYYSKNPSPYTSEQCYILAYLNSVASNNAPWLAIAGKTRGKIPSTKQTCGLITEDQYDEMQSEDAGAINVNPICNVNPFGIRIWGVRTCLPVPDDGLIATSYANIRILIADIKKLMYRTSQAYRFEQNSDILWVNFKSEINKTLDYMQQTYCIAGYYWEKQQVANKVIATLFITPIEPVEDFDLTIDLTDEIIIAE